MSFWNSAIGGFIGFSLGGPLGGLIGAVIGSKIGSKKYANSSHRFTSNQQQQAAFFAALFACLAKLAKADGIVSTEEVDKVDNFIKERFKFPSEQRLFAIKVFNHGNHTRDFTYIDDIVKGVIAVSDLPASSNMNWNSDYPDPASSNSPFRILNIGNTKKIYLLDFINTLEKELGKKIKRNYMPMQQGDVHSTLSDSSLLKRITGYNPKTNYKTGVKKFLNWYLNYYS